jgi:hypothetical protein
MSQLKIEKVSQPGYIFGFFLTIIDVCFGGRFIYFLPDFLIPPPTRRYKS